MLRYIAKRLLQLIPTLLLVSIIVFLMVRIIPGDPITLLYGVSESGGTSEEYLDAMRDKYGLNDPLIVQYFRWITGFVQGDMGTSLRTHKTILEELTNRYPYTVTLAVGGTVLVYDDLAVRCNGRTTVLPRKEFQLLYKLLSSPGKTFTRRQLMDEIWDLDTDSDEHTVNVHINRLRDRFRDNRDFAIVTVRGLGYKAVRL